MDNFSSNNTTSSSSDSYDVASYSVDYNSGDASYPGDASYAGDNYVSTSFDDNSINSNDTVNSCDPDSTPYSEADGNIDTETNGYSDDFKSSDYEIIDEYGDFNDAMDKVGKGATVVSTVATGVEYSIGPLAAKGSVGLAAAGATVVASIVAAGYIGNQVGQQINEWAADSDYQSWGVLVYEAFYDD